MKHIFIVLILSISLFASETVTDSDLILDYTPYETKEAWYYWQYNPEKHDYDGKVVPKGFHYKKNRGYVPVDAPDVPQNIRGTLIMGTLHNGNIQYSKSDVYESQIDIPALTAFTENISDIQGAFFERGEIYLVGKKKKKNENPICIAEDIPVSIQSTFSSGDQGAFTSIDPPENLDDRGKYGVLRYGGGVENTHVGQVLYESDRTLKLISLGFDNVTKQPVLGGREWHKTKLDFRKFRKNYKPEEWHQFWLGVKDMKIEVDGESGVLRFLKNRFYVRTKRVRLVNGRYEPYFEDEKKCNNATSRFVRHFNKNFKRYRKAFPVLDEMVGVAKLMAVMRWLRDSGVMIKINETDRRMFNVRYTPEKTPIIRVKKTRRIRREFPDRIEMDELNIGTIGGIDLQDFRFKNTKLKKFKESIQNNKDYLVFRLL